MRRGWMTAAAAVPSVTVITHSQQAQPSAAPAVALGAGLAPYPEGIVIDTIPPSATGAAIGMRAGDFILQVGGRAVTEPEVVLVLGVHPQLR